jgi:hypothetical protein
LSAAKNGKSAKIRAVFTIARLVIARARATSLLFRNLIIK